MKNALFNFYYLAFMITFVLFFNLDFFFFYNYFINILFITSLFIILIKSFLIFIFIVLVRVLVPRFKVESLTKIGWVYSMIFIFFNLFFFIIGYFF